LFKKAAVFTDIHLGMKGNSRVHNQDCEDYIDWYIEQAKAHNCETGLFCGDWHHNRNSLNLTTMDTTIRLLEKLGAAFENFYMFAGNHDLYYKDKRDVSSTEFARHIPGITVIEDMQVIEDVALVPWLVGDEWKKIEKLKAKYLFGHFELPSFYMNAMVQMPDHGELRSEHFKNQEYVFSGHFHKRQKQGKIHYIGNAFPHNYADAWDTFIKSKMYLRVNLDIDISYEEASFIKETFMEQYNCREITLIPQKHLEEITTDLDIEQFESVDQIVSNEILAIDSDNFNKSVLLEIYNGLE
jgi:DNA repair exonuclease SbcCD nuclease subunit